MGIVSGQGLYEEDMSGEFEAVSGMVPGGARWLGIGIWDKSHGRKQKPLKNTQFGRYEAAY
jgi:hypothetical protein